MISSRFGVFGRLTGVVLLLLLFSAVVVAENEQYDCYMVGCENRITIPKVAFLKASVDSSEEHSYYYEVCVDDMCSGRVHMTSDYESSGTSSSNDDDESYSYRTQVDGNEIDFTIPNPYNVGLSTEYYQTTAQRIEVNIGIDGLQNNNDYYDAAPIVWFFKMDAAFDCWRPNGEHCSPFCCAMRVTRRDLKWHAHVMDGEHVTLVWQSPLTRLLQRILVGVGLLVSAAAILWVRRHVAIKKAVALKNLENEKVSSSDIDYDRLDQATTRQID